MAVHLSTTKSKPDANIDHASSIRYWNSIPATVNGMLGGFPQVSRIDLRGSANFLAKLRRLMPKDEKTPATTTTTTRKLKLGVDCGAGIGRVTEGFLSKVCESVDVVEPVEKFAQVIRDGPLRKKKQRRDNTTGKEDETEEDNDKGENEGVIEDVYTVGLEHWQPEKKYDLIWNQWCVGHLTDAQLVAYLQRAADALTPNGFVVLKENISTDPNAKDIYDELDSSVTRTDETFKRIFKEAGLNLIKTEEQLGLPKHLGLLPVKFYALRPLPAT